MNKKKVKVDKNKFHKEAEKNAIKSPKKKTSFKEWRKNHRKSLLITYYSVAILVILICIGIILNNFVTRSEVTESEGPINYETEYVDDEDLELGTEEIGQEGVKGIKKIYTEEKKRLITGETVSYNVVDTKTVKEPIKKIVKRGTRKWQYMVCSDGSYRYFTDEQFQDPKIGFTHSSEDYCAKNNQGTMVVLSDAPPTGNSLPAPSLYSGDGKLSESYVSTLELIDRRERELRNDAENMCRKNAEDAKNNAESRLEATGVDKSQYTANLQLEYNTTYYRCMDNFGY